MNAVLEQELAKLSQQEKLKLLELIWDSLDVESVEQPMSDELFSELERRATWADQHPEESMTFDELARNIGFRP